MERGEWLEALVLALEEGKEVGREGGREGGRDGGVLFAGVVATSRDTDGERGVA